MNHRSFGRFIIVITTGLGVGGCTGEVTSAVGEGEHVGRAAQGQQVIESIDGDGILRTVADGTIDTNGPFFQSLGTNGRSCSTCHAASDAWTLTPTRARALFDATDGTDPLFRPNDGAVSPNADVSTVDARRAAYAMLLTKGLVRVEIAPPANAEFDVAAVDDPYGYATPQALSLFRRPLPCTNVRFLTTLMWDGRVPLTEGTLHYDLGVQANQATRGHAQGTQDLTQDQRDAIVAMETSLYTAQAYDWYAGDLGAAGAYGGPAWLGGAPFHFGINDALGNDPTGAVFDPRAFTLFAAWAPPPWQAPHLGPLTSRGRGAAHAAAIASTASSCSQTQARAQIARGEELFDTLPIAISRVGGLNDALTTPVIQGHCTTCHDTPGVGNHSVPGALDLGLTDVSRRTPDLPLYTLRNRSTGETRQTTDPGRALVTGRWIDIGRFKGPILRALAGRAPYFHNGSAATLDDVVAMYDDRFALHLTAAQKADLAAFLRSL